MSKKLLTDIEKLLVKTGLSEPTFCRRVNNGRLLERLRAGREILPSTEKNYRKIMSEIAKKNETPPKQEEQAQ